jgi:hypothetical protein
MSVVPEYKRLRAPRGHGQTYVEPPLDELGALARSNAGGLLQFDADLQGRSFRQLRQEARQELLQSARRYTAAYRDVPVAGAADSTLLLLAGHQPQLFHAGVWFKNFVLSSLGQQLGAAPVNLLIDNDILSAASIRVPTPSPAGWQVEALAFDQGSEALPYEERQIRDGDCFASFGRRVLAALPGAQEEPLVRRYWPLVLAASQRSRNVGRCLAEARHRIEGDWQQQTLEVPLSTVCSSLPFAWFAAHLLAHLPRLHAVHNTSLSEYRRVNRLRSRSHPVPDLAREGAWWEAPFWLWTRDAPRRRRLFVRPGGAGLELTDRESWHTQLPLGPDASAERAVEAWRAWGERGVRLRPRALITTMYARLMLADLFLHGIGGAKYDQLTDAIIDRFFGLRAPPFATLSATALLFPDRTAQLRAELQQTRARLRELRYAPERHLARTPEIETLLAAKRQWLAQAPPRGQRRARHQGIEQVNLALQPWLAAQRESCGARVRELTAELRRQAALASREFAFCLFSEAQLRPLLLACAQQVA